MKRSETNIISLYSKDRNCTRARRSRAARIRQRSLRIRGTAAFASLLLLLAVCLFNLTPQNAQASGTQQAPVYKYYTTIRVNAGDTLWDIAEEYMTEEYSSIHSYIEEVKTMNHLSSSTITDGMYLSIPYYSTEYMA